MSTYYEITAKIEGKDKILFGSFEKSDCTYELQNEREGWNSRYVATNKLVVDDAFSLDEHLQELHCLVIDSINEGDLFELAD